MARWRAVERRQMYLVCPIIGRVGRVRRTSDKGVRPHIKEAIEERRVRVQ